MVKVRLQNLRASIQVNGMKGKNMEQDSYELLVIVTRLMEVLLSKLKCVIKGYFKMVYSKVLEFVLARNLMDL